MLVRLRLISYNRYNTYMVASDKDELVNLQYVKRIVPIKISVVDSEYESSKLTNVLEFIYDDSSRYYLGTLDDIPLG